MAYITKEFFQEKGFKVYANMNFDRLSEIASDVIYEICVVKPDSVIENMNDFKKAVCYEVEMLYEQGGTDAIVGFSEASQGASSESLGSYSVSGSSSVQEAIMTSNGIPVSSMSIMLLRKIGLMQRCAYVKASDLYAQ